MRAVRSILTVLLLGLLGFVLASGSAHAQPSNRLIATTNQGQLVEIDLTTGTAQVLGIATPPAGAGSQWGWTDLAFDPAGDLYAVSRNRGEPTTTAHLYQIDLLGRVLLPIGNTGIRWISDIDFTQDGALYGNTWENALPLTGNGGLLLIDPFSAVLNIPPNSRFGGAASLPCCRDLENGGLSVHPTTGELWGVESSFAFSRWASPPHIFQIDPTTGLAQNIVPIGLFGTPSAFGFDALEILPDGRFIAIRGAGSSDVYEINPIPDAISGLAGATLIPLLLDPSIQGGLNGLDTAPPTELLVTNLVQDVIDLNLGAGISNALDAKLELVVDALDDMNQNNDVAAENSLYAFMNAVEAQRGKKLTDAEADDLIAAAQAIINALDG